MDNSLPGYANLVESFSNLYNVVRRKWHHEKHWNLFPTCRDIKLRNVASWAITWDIRYKWPVWGKEPATINFSVIGKKAWTRRFIFLFAQMLEVFAFILNAIFRRSVFIDYFSNGSGYIIKVLAVLAFSNKKNFFIIRV